MKTLLLCIGFTATAGIGTTAYILRRPHQESPKEFPFIYYPSVNLYYDVSDHYYVYPVDHNGTRLWDRIPKRTKEVPLALGKGIVFYSSNPEVWQENEAHQKQYGGSLSPLVDSARAAKPALHPKPGPAAPVQEAAVREAVKEKKEEAHAGKVRRENRYEQELRKKLQKAWAGKEWKAEEEGWN